MLIKSSLRLCAIIAIASLHSTPALAVPIVWELTGSVDSTSSPFPGLGSLFLPGAPTCFTLMFDTDYATSSFGRSYGFDGTAREHFGFVAQVGGHDYRWSGQGQSFLHFSPGSVVLDTSLSGRAVSGETVGTGPFWYPLAFDVGLNVGSDGLPNSHQPGTFTLYLADRSGALNPTGIVHGSFSSVAQVPSPPTFLLVALGLVGAAGYRWRRH